MRTLSGSSGWYESIQDVAPLALIATSLAACAKEVHNLVRGVNPWPSAYTNYMDKKMKVWKTKVLDEKSSKEPGTILKVDQDGIKVATKDNVILISEIQMPNKKRMEVKEFIKGNTLEVGNVLQ